jgi:hypothetical protein
MSTAERVTEEVVEPQKKKMRSEEKRELAWLTDAREPTETRNYVFDLVDAPRCLTRALRCAREQGVRSFPFLCGEDGIDGLAGLVDEAACANNADDPDVVAEEMFAYFDAKASPQNLLRPPCSLSIAFEFVLAG